MHLEVFAEGDSLFHKTDPRVKIIALSVFAVFCAISQGILVPGMYLIFAVILIIIAKPSFKGLMERLFAANFFVLFIWLFVPLTYGSSPFFRFWILKFSVPGIIYCFSITLKCNAIVLATIALIATSTVFDLAHAMLHFKIPARLVTLFFLFYRYISVMHEEYTKIKRAVLARGFVPKTSLHTYKTYAYLVGALLLKSFERSDEVYKAMLCRGFKGFFPLLEHFKLRLRDIFVGSIIILFSTAIFVFQWVK
ncbi:MAG: cobalt ECF transporter T component CbiQ [Thermodesulfobacteria bacterium]|nr:cobalt ECF transporter T component CbiQ [Thermodesulfobacteriota bacterium]